MLEAGHGADPVVCDGEDEEPDAPDAIGAAHIDPEGRLASGSRPARPPYGDILVYASARLVRTLVARGLADELRQVVFPVVLGAGQRLFDEPSGRMPLRLVDTRKLGDGLVHHTYRFASASR